MNIVNNKGKAKLFSNTHLELLTSANPLFLWIAYPIVIPSILSYGIYVHPELIRPSSVLWFILGLISWTLFEYLVHRFLFHYKPRRNWTKRLLYIFHENHHEYPRDKKRLLMPPLPATLLATILFITIYSMLGKLVYVYFPGFVSGYLLYSVIHYSIHAFAPPFKWLKPLWRNHLLHHYKGAGKGFGVSTPFWDRVMGTSYENNETVPGDQVDHILFARNEISKN